MMRRKNPVLLLKDWVINPCKGILQFFGRPLGQPYQRKPRSKADEDNPLVNEPKNLPIKSPTVSPGVESCHESY